MRMKIQYLYTDLPAMEVKLGSAEGSMERNHESINHNINYIHKLTPMETMERAGLGGGPVLEICVIWALKSALR